MAEIGEVVIDDTTMPRLPMIEKRRVNSHRKNIVERNISGRPVDKNDLYLDLVDLHFLAGFQTLWLAYHGKSQTHGATLLPPLITLAHSFLDSHINCTLSEQIVVLEDQKTIFESHFVEFWKNLRALTLNSAQKPEKNKFKIIAEYLRMNGILKLSQDLISDLELLCDLRDGRHHFEGDFTTAWSYTEVTDRLANRLNLKHKQTEAMFLDIHSTEILEFLKVTISEVIFLLNGHFTNNEKLKTYHLDWNLEPQLMCLVYRE